MRARIEAQDNPDRSVQLIGAAPDRRRLKPGPALAHQWTELPSDPENLRTVPMMAD
jgi:hypothetical protein